MLAQGDPAVARARCADVTARRGQIQVGMRWSDARELLGVPDYENTRLDGVTSVIYNATCGTYGQQLLLNVKDDAVIGVY